MNRIDLIEHVLLIPSGLIVLFWTLYLMVSPLKFALGFALFLITIVVGELLLFSNEGKPDNGSHGKPSRSYRISGELVILVAFVLSLAIMLLVPAIKGEIFVEWAALDLLNVARLVAAFGMNFFPGYLILAIVEKQELDKLPKLIASYFLSFFVLMITAFVSARIIGVVDEFFLDTFLFMCTSLIVVYLVKRLVQRKPRLEKKSNSTPFSTRFRKMLPALLVGLTAVFMSIWFWWMYSRNGFFLGAQGTDMWRIHGTAQHYLDYKAFNLLQWPWWLNLYLASSAILSGVPLANAYMALHPFIILSILSFYAMSSVFFKDKRIASIATLSYAIFSGPGGLYASYLRTLIPITSYSDWKIIIYQAADKFLLQGRYPSFVVGLNGGVIAYAALFWLMYATWKLDPKRKFNIFLMGITLAISYGIHGIEPVIFVVYLTALLVVCFLTRNNEGKERVKLGAWSVLLGIGIVALIDVFLTSEYDYFNSVSPYALTTRYFYFNSLSFYALTFSSTLILALTYSKFVQNKIGQFCDSAYERLSPKKINFFKSRLAEMVFYLYGVSLVIFVMLFPSLSIQTMGIGSVPWYVYLAMGGVPSFLGLVGVAMVLRKWNELETRIRDILVFCALSVFLLFLFGQTVSFINENYFYTGFWERRTFVYIFPMLSLLMAFAVVNLFGSVPVKELKSLKHLGRIGMVSLLASLIMIGGVSSTLVAGDFAQVGYFVDIPTEEELEALKFLHYSLPKGSKAGYINRQTGLEYIRAFASDKWTYDPFQWLGRFSYSPSSFISALRSADIHYFYLNRIRDSLDLERDLFLQQLIKVLPVEFNNTEVTIYSIPPLQTPSLFSSLSVVSPRETEGATYDAYVLWFWTLVMSEYSYSVIANTSDSAVLDYTENIIMSYDPSQSKEDAGQLIEWVSNGGHLIVSNTNEFGIFAESIGLKTKLPLVNCDSTESWATAYKRGEISVENAVKIEGTASLRLQNNLSSWEGWIYEPSTPWNLSRDEYLGIWVYGAGEAGGPIWYLYLTDSDGNTGYYRYHLSVFDYQTKEFVPAFKGWKMILIPIKEYYGHLNLSNITKLQIDTGYQLPVNILIDEIFVVEESEERSAVLADGIEGEVSIDLPPLEVEDLGFSVDAEIIANYTKDGVSIAPFAFQKDFGSGKVTYLNANLLYDFILSEGSRFESPYEELLEILTMIGVKGQ